MWIVIITIVIILSFRRSSHVSVAAAVIARTYIINIYYYYIFIHNSMDRRGITKHDRNIVRRNKTRRTSWVGLCFPGDRMEYYWKKDYTPWLCKREKCSQNVPVYHHDIYIIWRRNNNISAAVGYTFLIAINLCRSARVHCAYHSVQMYNNDMIRCIGTH